jgi:hypothetical protein
VRFRRVFNDNWSMFVHRLLSFFCKHFG